MKDRSRPLLLTLTRTNDVQVILQNRQELAKHRGIFIRPDLPAEQRKTQSLPLKERWSFLQSGVARSDIKIKGNTLLVKGQKCGYVSNNVFIRCPQAEQTIEKSSPPSRVCSPIHTSTPLPRDSQGANQDSPQGSSDTSPLHRCTTGQVSPDLATPSNVGNSNTPL